jgi:hypothetical protein
MPRKEMQPTCGLPLRDGPMEAVPARRSRWRTCSSLYQLMPASRGCSSGGTRRYVLMKVDGDIPTEPAIGPVYVSSTIVSGSSRRSRDATARRAGLLRRDRLRATTTLEAPRLRATSARTRAGAVPSIALNCPPSSPVRARFRSSSRLRDVELSATST